MNWTKDYKALCEYIEFSLADVSGAWGKYKDTYSDDDLLMFKHRAQSFSSSFSQKVVTFLADNSEVLPIEYNTLIGVWGYCIANLIAHMYWLSLAEPMPGREKLITHGIDYAWEIFNTLLNPTQELILDKEGKDGGQ